MTQLTTRPGFDWARVRWDDADAPQRNDCSCCGLVIDEESVPLRFWNERGDGAVFCGCCVDQWFVYVEEIEITVDGLP